MKWPHLSSLCAALLVPAFLACGGATASDPGGSGGGTLASGGTTASGGSLASGGSGGETASGGAAPLVDVEEWAAWQAEAAPRTGSHDVWTRDDCNGAYLGSTSEPIGPEYRVLPNVSCHVSADFAVNERECSIRPYCESSADCTDGSSGRCVGQPDDDYPLCYYPEAYPALPPQQCSLDADCTQAPGGRCSPQDAWHCYPWGVCLPPVSYCAYDSLHEVGCESDADCTSLPDGECILPIRNAGCVYDTCFEDEDCDAGTRCGCGRCQAADCGDECPSGETCEFNAPYCGYPWGFHCTTPEDECDPSDSGCYYEDGHFVVLMAVCE